MQPFWNKVCIWLNERVPLQLCPYATFVWFLLLVLHIYLKWNFPNVLLLLNTLTWTWKAILTAISTTTISELICRRGVVFKYYLRFLFVKRCTRLEKAVPTYSPVFGVEYYIPVLSKYIQPECGMAFVRNGVWVLNVKLFVIVCIYYLLMYRGHETNCFRIELSLT